MTEEVQPLEAPPDESPGFVVRDYLTKVLGTLTFENFAPVPNGNITICGILFHYRVGLFLGVPSQAIVACGQFVKLQQSREKAQHWTNLKVLEPELPEKCLYQHFPGSPDRWEPPSKESPAAAILQQLATMQQAQAAQLKQAAMQNPLYQGGLGQGLMQPLFQGTQATPQQPPPRSYTPLGLGDLFKKYLGS
jgi:hypothetical protein